MSLLKFLGPASLLSMSALPIRATLHGGTRFKLLGTPVVTALGVLRLPGGKASLPGWRLQRVVVMRTASITTLRF